MVVILTDGINKDLRHSLDKNEEHFSSLLFSSELTGGRSSRTAMILVFIYWQYDRFRASHVSKMVYGLSADISITH